MLGIHLFNVTLIRSLNFKIMQLVDSDKSFDVNVVTSIAFISSLCQRFKISNCSKDSKQQYPDVGTIEGTKVTRFLGPLK